MKAGLELKGRDTAVADMKLECRARGEDTVLTFKKACVAFSPADDALGIQRRSCERRIGDSNLYALLDIRSNIVYRYQDSHSRGEA